MVKSAIAVPVENENPSLRRDDDRLILSVASLSLRHFRNYSAMRMELSPARVIVLAGHNGAGKTNVLEALSLLTPGRGLRKARISELDRLKVPSPFQGEKSKITPSPFQGEGWGEGSFHGATNPHPTLSLEGRGLNRESWVVSARATGMQGDVQIGTGRDPENTSETDRRIIRIDGKPSRSQSELGRHLAMLWLTPQMEQLFQEGTSAARKFLDRLVYSFDPDHASRVNEYDYAMRERNRLLQAGNADAIWLDALEQTMAETASAIAVARLQTASSINHAMSLSRHGFPRAHIAVSGAAETPLEAGEPAVSVENSLRSAWAQSRRQDAAAGRTLSGAHRSEMRVTHLEKQMLADYCSTGEQKALLLSIVLAQARAGAMWRHVVPVLLFDEVAAHLDGTRRLELFEEICQIGAQTWMTGTDAAIFADLGENAQVFRVENGSIRQDER